MNAVSDITGYQISVLSLSDKKPLSGQPVIIFIVIHQSGFIQKIQTDTTLAHRHIQSVRNINNTKQDFTIFILPEFHPEE
ncbi:hypothetical protein, partial [Escherichia coli]|uniref:hypothetical protein n=1 Tax=Escherichia coli TaxID=562 RepID=UPI001BC97B81